MRGFQKHITKLFAALTVVGTLGGCYYGPGYYGPGYGGYYGQYYQPYYQPYAVYGVYGYRGCCFGGYYGRGGYYDHGHGGPGFRGPPGGFRGLGGTHETHGNFSGAHTGGNVSSGNHGGFK